MFTNCDIDPLKELPGVPEAEYGSYMDQYEDECLSGTRTALLNDITTWAKSPQGKCIFWLNGMAGTGKSTISRTVAGILQRDNLLGASFFFKWGEADRGNARKFIPTIAKQLILRYPELTDSIRETVRANPGIMSKSLNLQFDRLLYRPLRALGPQAQGLSTAVIVIDALDECENEQDVEAILHSLPSLQDANTVNIRIFLTSRPELPIRQAFSEIPDRSFQDFVLHEMIAREATEHDISLFLKHQFTKIRKARRIPSSWPRDEDLHALVTISVPLFISAATLCRFIGDKKWQPTVRLAEVLKDQAKYATKMEKTYFPILERLLAGQNDEDSELLLHEFQEIIGTIILLAEPLSINALAELLGLEMEVITNRLESFSSIIHTPEDPSLPTRIMHLSLRDFLTHSKSKFRVESRERHGAIALQCLAVMRKRLRKNICNLKRDDAERSDIPLEALQQRLPLELQYACHYWVFHLTQSLDPLAEAENVFDFLQEHFLHWIEALNLLGLGSEAVEMLGQLQSSFAV
jgi:hypothetical protein